MSPKVAGPRIAARKGTTLTGSKSWKQHLRRVCLDRARRQKRDLCGRNGNKDVVTSGLRDGHVVETEGLISGGYYDDYFVDGINTAVITPARAVVEEAMRQQGVFVLTPCASDGVVVGGGSSPPRRQSSSGRQNRPHMVIEDSPSPGRFASDASSSFPNDFGVDGSPSGGNQMSAQDVTDRNYISEEELFELLEEVEEEMQRMESWQLEEALELAREEQRDLEDQIAEYEQWEEEKMAEEQEQHHEESGCFELSRTECVKVLCPICHEADVIESYCGNTPARGYPFLLCPNHMDGSCSFKIPCSLAPSLLGLRERLGAAYEEHASFCQTGCLSFEMIHDDTAQQSYNGGSLVPQRSGDFHSNLLASCSTCGTRGFIFSNR